jgi:hypothetical protein
MPWGKVDIFLFLTSLFELKSFRFLDFYAIRMEYSKCPALLRMPVSACMILKKKVKKKLENVI